MAIAAEDDPLITVLEGIGDSFYALDAAWRFTYLNRNAEQYFGTPRERLLGRVIWEVFPGADGTELQRFMEEAMALRVTAEIETDTVIVPGRFVQFRVFPYRDGLAIAFRDRTAERVAREALAESEAQFRALAEALPQQVWIMRSDGFATFMNQRFREYHGIEIGPGREDRGATIHPDDRAAAFAVRAAAMRAGEPFTVDVRTCRHDGEYRWQRMAVVPLRRPGGEPSSWIGTATDIDDMRRAQDALVASEEKLRLAVDATKLGLWDYDIPTEKLVWSDELKALYGFAPTEEVDFRRYYRTIHLEDQKRSLAAYEAALDPDGGGRFSFQHRVVRADGAVRWIEAAGRVLFDESRRPVRAIGTAADITERKHDEARLHTLVGELNHRVKNAMAVAQAIASYTLRGSTTLAEAKAAMSGRFNALGAAVDLLTQSNWGGADIQALIELNLSGFPGRVTASGPSITLTPRAAQTLSLVLYELASNAAKHGALSAPSGRVLIEWSAGPEGFRFAWREENGPRVAASTHRGFGHSLLERVASADLSAEVTLDYAEDGLRYLILAPADDIVTAR